MTNQTKTHWKQLINPDYIGAYAIPDGEDLTVTIDFVRVEQITGSGGKKEECTVAHLKGQKPMILNVTNSKSIHKLYGPYIEDWAGQQITLYASTTKMAGEVVECLRVRPHVMRKKDAISDARLEQAIGSIKAGSFSVEKLNAKFELTTEQSARLTKALEPVHD
jgi:hypothetical protein